MATAVVSFRDAPPERAEELLSRASAFLDRHQALVELLPVRASGRTVALVVAGTSAGVEFTAEDLVAHFRRDELPTPQVETSEQAQLWIAQLNG